jgi:hypothetical protein
MGNLSTIERLKGRWGDVWLTRLRDTINSSSGFIHTSDDSAAQALGVSPSNLKRMCEQLGIERRFAFLLPGDVLVIERDGERTVISDRTPAK